MRYGSEPNSLDQVSDPITSTADISEVDVSYLIQLEGLSAATVYYFRIAATYDTVFTRYSELSVFRTLENGMQLLAIILLRLKVHLFSSP